ncbi:MAG: ATP phosphoribosyltransferase [Saccharofermentans sp.]|nr:ATP phosphoribosyltransferase [Saccharofermentans sp.]
MLTIALSKGRLADQAIELLEKAGYDCTAAKEKSRKLILEDPTTGLRFILAKPTDVPTYVEYGAADIGVVGKDTLLEAGRQLYEVIDLGFGKCRLCVAGPKNLKDGKFDLIPNKRIATKYPNITRSYFEGIKKESVEIIKLNGSIELAPLIGLADVIVDIVESGRTLIENDLDVIETVADNISARVVVNRVSMKMKSDEIRPMIDKLKVQVDIMNREKAVNK